jgi:hypothetical protein
MLGEGAAWRACISFCLCHLVCACSTDEAARAEPGVWCTGSAEACASVDFERDIQPILADQCVRCHGGVRELGGLNLETRRGAAHVLGCAGCDASKSQLYARVSASEEAIRMPLAGAALPAEQVAKLKEWIEAGAPWPEHWAYAPVQARDPLSLPVSDEAWVLSPIDRFILNRLERAALQPSAVASRETLLRRASLDLTGLPPSLAELDAFIADTSPDAFETVVDRLLASPAYGERWGRHWLDQARFSESDGYEKDTPRGGAFRYRDWVVTAFNSDLPFDRFVTLQIAGDLVPNADEQTRIATAFNTQSMHSREAGVDPEEDRLKRVNERTVTMANAFLGLTLQCTQCHGHPYDRFSQVDFYSLSAYFNNADEKPFDEPDMSSVGSQVPFESLTNATRQTYLLLRGDFRNPDKSRGSLTPGTPRSLPGSSTGASRLDLAAWLASPSNPLTARVRVNTIWSHLFGRGIVATLGDFGARGALPTEPELLDWLAQDFVDHVWSQKYLIREIVLSQAYRQVSTIDAEHALKDPGNALFGRQGRGQLEAEPILDSVMFVGGLLKLQVGGPSVFPPLAPELQSLARGPYSDFNWPVSSGPDRYRRSIYTFHKRSLPYPTLAVFGWPVGTVSTNGRDASSSPLQALSALHEVTFVDGARALARRVQMSEVAGLDARLDLAFRLALARTPGVEEHDVLRQAWTESEARYALALDQANLLIGAEPPPGASPSEAAAWVTTAQTIMNLDEFFVRE